MKRFACISACGALDSGTRYHIARVYEDFCTANDITGIMVYASPTLFHVFEGTAQGSLALLTKLGEDLFQRDLDILTEEQIRARLFDTWAFENTPSRASAQSKMVGTLMSNLDQCSDAMSRFLMHYFAVRYVQ